MKAKHTPGPWRITDTRSGSSPVRTWGIETSESNRYDRRYVAKIDAGKEMEANARLIAAAPELLEALAAVRTSLGYFYDSTAEANDHTMRKHGKALELAESALRKARGE